MARFDSIKQTIDSNIKSNGNQEITGQKLNSVLNGMISSVDVALTAVENAIPEEIVPPVGGEKELMQVYLGDLTSEQKAANVEVFNALAEGKGIIPYALYSNNIPMPFTSMTKWTVSGVADHFTLKWYNLDTLAEGKCSVVAVVINSDGTTSSSQSDINLPTGEGAGNSVEAAILEFNSSGLTAEQKAHNAEIYRKLFNNEPVQAYLNLGMLTPLQYSSISYETGIITLSASVIITSEPSVLAYISLKLSPDGDLQAYEQTEYPLGGSSEGGVAELMVSTTYADLVALRDAGNLVPGMKYRITDYETITTKEGSQSAGHPFDIIVTALDNKTISENASAIQSARDTNSYFKQANLKAWQLKYALDNLDGRFDFVPQDNKEYILVNISFNEQVVPVPLFKSDRTTIINGVTYHIYDTNMGETSVGSLSDEIKINDTLALFEGNEYIGEGVATSVESVAEFYGCKGIIYRMTDEQGNSCPYDFKNIMFLRTDSEDVQKYEYTFSNRLGDDVDDISVRNPLRCYDNIMEDGCWDNVFALQGTSDIKGNRFGEGCEGNTLGVDCSNIKFGAECKNNKLLGHNNNCVFGDDCSNNVLGSLSSGCEFGLHCLSNKLGKQCMNNKFGSYCINNELGEASEYNEFGISCYNNRMGKYSNANIFGNDCNSVLFVLNSSGTDVRDYNRNNIIGSGSKYLKIYNSNTPSQSAQIQNMHIYPGIEGSPGGYISINIPMVSQDAHYTVARTSNGAMKIFSIADLVQ